MTDKPKPREGNGPLSREAMRAAFGEHPHKDWKPQIRKRAASWWKKPKDEG